MVEIRLGTQDGLSREATSEAVNSMHATLLLKVQNNLNEVRQGWEVALGEALQGVTQDVQRLLDSRPPQGLQPSDVAFVQGLSQQITQLRTTQDNLMAYVQKLYTRDGAYNEALQRMDTHIPR